MVAMDVMVVDSFLLIADISSAPLNNRDPLDLLKFFYW